MQAETKTNTAQKDIICEDNYGKCRCCLTFGNHQHNFGKAEQEMLMENFNLYLMTDLRLPHLLCSVCVTSLHDVQRFRRKVVESETKLRLTITEEIKSENVEQSYQNDPLDISTVKAELYYGEPLSINSVTADVIVDTADCKTVKVEFEPFEETSRDNKSKTTVKSENESSSDNKSSIKPKAKKLVKTRKSHMISQDNKSKTTVKSENESSSDNKSSIKTKAKKLVKTRKSHMISQGSKGLRMLPQSTKGLRLVPINSKELPLAPQNSKGLRLVPVSSKGLCLVPLNSKGLNMVPRNSKGIRLLPISSKGLHMVPESSKGLHVEPQSGKEICTEALTDDASNIKKENELAINNRKRKLKDGTQTSSKKEKSGSESDNEIFETETNESHESRVEKILANLETARHLLLKDNSKVRSNIILILKHSTILPFRNNFKCFYCDKLYTTFKELKEHTETEHNEVSETTISKIIRSTKNLIITADISCIKCRLCDQMCKTIEDLVEHFCKIHQKVYHETDRKPSHGILGVDLSTDTLKCQICKKDHSFFKNLLVHMNEHYGVFVCYICGKKFLSDRRYKNHVINTHANQEIKCKECNKIFKTEPAMKYHVKKIHLGNKTRVKCIYCPETFASGNYVKRINHMAEVHGVAKPIFKCDICGIESANSASLARHKTYTHKRTKVNTCALCGYMTCDNSAMKKHMVVHSGVKNFECEFCKKKFAKSGTLKLHLKIHLNDKRFVCFLCDAAFIQKNSLKNHLQSRHPDSGMDVHNF